MGKQTKPEQVAWTLFAVEVRYADGRRYLLGSYGGQVPECWSSPGVAETAAKANRGREGVADAVVVPVACTVAAAAGVAAA